MRKILYMVLYLITRQIDPFFKSIAAYILLNLARISERFSRLKNDIIEDVPWGTHFCQFYQTKEDLMETLIPYFKAGLENNELCFWVTSQALEVEEAIEALRRVIPDFDVY
jgi:MEDS: MEthanogen/methylotroph, DcmR Sensory domain